MDVDTVGRTIDKMTIEAIANNACFLIFHSPFIIGICVIAPHLGASAVLC
jgi:hypothetical protein